MSELIVSLGEDFFPIDPRFHRQKPVAYSKGFRIDSIEARGGITWLSYRLLPTQSPLIRWGEIETALEQRLGNYVYPFVSFYLRGDMVLNLVEGASHQLRVKCLLEDKSRGVIYCGTPNNRNFYDGELWDIKRVGRDYLFGWLIEYWRAIEDNPYQLEEAWKRIMGEDYEWKGEGGTLLVPKKPGIWAFSRMRFVI
ncbi:MAG: hypothetical protein UU73_C0003G0076 [Candidatus Daviesbacteria bacterium GW2011_GWA1_41_61]|uniref:Uncharacterized protein n=1 Tax=Candidatus Daviesbacteria bacterium GW2011_GWA2_40_9 TaxID=1618424 RepID=A0A0G0X6H2_9BACT|nr:MAG: hypothetical protein UU26_C0003G0152 [Candidatus Daviesbacteria bacterium GW2011_GWC1_40_9]KKR83227.1 MAG: hypothetical protein UU29_C0007G0097 [Candidatus Daviesbacteria bacterium GW2011_GWA2_40_9]KKR93572.1 MAG: hypothetical protein UU44_C0002G0233 [Candidatus Daviesbacteria bacterium GW2011_GWB1_41_15]KKS14877.1 MAG: hypothetical protein UU73_C0003G0076 [Candidatus Daviesbacteria bacterium GW2011_GWA1_41_61]